MYNLIFTQSYENRVKNFLKRHPEVTGQYQKTLQLLELNPLHQSLRLHKFKTKNFEGHSVSINLSYRISLEFLIQDQSILLVNIGDHYEVYGKK